MQCILQRTSISCLRFKFSFTTILDQNIFPWEAWKSLDPSGAVPRSLFCEKPCTQDELISVGFRSPGSESQHQLKQAGRKGSSRLQGLLHHPRALPGQTPPKDQSA